MSEEPQYTEGELPPPPLADEAAAPGLAVEELVDETHDRGHPVKEDRFRTYVAIAIALVSILGAIVAFNGTLAEQDARRLDQQGIQDAAQQQQIVTDLQATVDEDLRNLAPYQEHLKAAQLLDDEANSLQHSDPISASLLRAQAQSERVLARTRAAFFQGAVPAAGDNKAPVNYDAAAVLKRLENNNSQLQQLRPDATLAEAEDKHAQSVNLVGLVTLFIAALLFLTLAQFTRPSIRRLFAGAGGAVAGIGIALWVVVLVSGP